MHEAHDGFESAALRKQAFHADKDTTSNSLRAILKEVALATSTWRTVAKEVRAASSEIHRMASAFEHDSLRQALALP